MKYFQGAYGCIDGSHFPIELRSEERENWRNRKGFISTNAILITDVEFFVYAMFGAEGAGGDSVIVQHASTTHDLPWIPNGYLIGDAGYALSHKLLTPYRGVRYHLREFTETAAGRPHSKEELFNLRHSTFRNQVERAIGIVKARFRILRESLRMENKSEMWETQYCCIALHNFIRVENSSLDDNLEHSVEEEEEEEEDLMVNELGKVDNQHAINWRDQAAVQMWNDYIH